jgi:hypothetical protein
MPGQGVGLHVQPRRGQDGGDDGRECGGVDDG